METYNGLVRTPTDAIILFEACRLGLLPRVQRRLSEKERQSIRSGSVFVWDEREAGMRRWTDGKSWSASRVSGSFLTYREMEGKRGSTSSSSSGNRATKTPENGPEDDGADGEEGPDGYRYKPDGLMKQSFSITTSQGQHLHLISYYSRSSPTSQVLRQPSQDPNLASIQPAKGMYPESTVNDQSTVPAVTRSPMPGAPNYVMAPNPAYGRPPPHPHAYLPPGYIPHPAYMAYPLSPMHTPPPYAMHYATAHGIPMGYAPFPQQAMGLNQAPPSMFDQRPVGLPRASQPPPAPYTQSAPPPPVTQPSQPSTYSTSQPPQLSPYGSNYGTTNSTYAPASSRGQAEAGAERSNGLQIDPRLTAPPALTPGSTVDQDKSATPQPDGLPPMSESVENGASAATTQGQALPTMVSEGPKTNGTVATTGPSEADSTRDGSISPGGTKRTAPPQDIPSEKLGFSADKRALSMLDRAFARV